MSDLVGSRDKVVVGGNKNIGSYIKVLLSTAKEASGISSRSPKDILKQVLSDRGLDTEI